MRDEDYNSKFKSGTELLQGLFESGKNPLSEQFIRWKMWSRWEEIVGPTLAKSTEPVGWQWNTLLIWVPHSTVMQQMQFLKQNILQAVQKAYPQLAIKDVRFTLDRKQTPKDGVAKEEAQHFIRMMKK
jgi:predicted nucleic acid-binding Zn ribbon protein